MLADGWDYTELENIDGLNNLRSVEKIEFYGLDYLTLIKLPNLRSISTLHLSWLVGLEEIHPPQLNTINTLLVSATRIENFDGLSTINSVNSRVGIYNNPDLNDFCGLQQALINTSDYEVEGNGFNPTQTDLSNGNCSE